MIIYADRIITRLDRMPLVAGAVVVKYGQIHLSVNPPQY